MPTRPGVTTPGNRSGALVPEAGASELAKPSDVQVEAQVKQKMTLEDSRPAEDYLSPVKKTTLTSLKKATNMKATGRGPGNNSPVAKKVVIQRELRKTPNLKR